MEKLVRRSGAHDAKEHLHLLGPVFIRPFTNCRAKTWSPGRPRRLTVFCSCSVVNLNSCHDPEPN